MYQVHVTPGRMFIRFRIDSNEKSPRKRTAFRSLELGICTENILAPVGRVANLSSFLFAIGIASYLTQSDHLFRIDSSPVMAEFLRNMWVVTVDLEGTGWLSFALNEG